MHVRVPPAPSPLLLDLLGNSPLVRITTPLPRPHNGFWAKLEYLSAGGMKARAAISMLQGARARGELLPGSSIVESTSGTLGLGLSFAGQALGHPIILVVDAEIEPHMRSLLMAHGARLEIVDKPVSPGGWQQARLERVQQVLNDVPGAYWPDQYNNPDNPAGYLSLAAELIEQLDHIDTLVCSVGTGGHSAGIIHMLRRHWPNVRLVGVDATGSTIFGQPARHRLMRGLGNSMQPGNVPYREFDEVHWVNPAEAVHACRQLAAHSFVSGGWSTGAVGLVAAWLARNEPNKDKHSKEIVAIFPDGPHRYIHTIYDDDFCVQCGLFPHEQPENPQEIANPAAAEVTQWTRCQTIFDPLRQEPRLSQGTELSSAVSSVPQ